MITASEPCLEPCQLFFSWWKVYVHLNFNEPLVTMFKCIDSSKGVLQKDKKGKITASRNQASLEEGDVKTTFKGSEDQNVVDVDAIPSPNHKKLRSSTIDH